MLLGVPQNRRVYIEIENLGELTRRSIRHGFFSLGKDLHRIANREILRKPKSGRTYIVRDRAGRRRRHVASAPGETHANKSGTLRKSIGWKLRGSRGLEWGYGGAPDNRNAPPEWSVIELGTFRVRPRPSLRNAMDSLDRNAERFFERSFQDEIRG